MFSDHINSVDTLIMSSLDFRYTSVFRNRAVFSQSRNTEETRARNQEKPKYVTIQRTRYLTLTNFTVFQKLLLKYMYIYCVLSHFTELQRSPVTKTGKEDLNLMRAKTQKIRTNEKEKKNL